MLCWKPEQGLQTHLLCRWAGCAQADCFKLVWAAMLLALLCMCWVGNVDEGEQGCGL